jgi:MFS family permease
MIASFLALTFFPAAPILLGLLALTVGGLGLALQRKTAPLPGRGTAPAGRTEARTVHVARFTGVGSLFAMLLALGAMFGLVNLSVVAFASSADPALTGLLLAALSFGSLVSGIVLGVVARTWRLTTQVRVAVLTLTLALAPLALITAPWLFAAVAFLAGLSVSTVMIGTFGLVERMVPRTRITEGMAFIGSALSLGMAAGTSVAGVLIDTHGTSVSLAAAALCAGGAAAVFWARLPRISAAEAGADSRDHSSGQTPHDAELALSAAGTA